LQKSAPPRPSDLEIRNQLDELKKNNPLLISNEQIKKQLEALKNE